MVSIKKVSVRRAIRRTLHAARKAKKAITPANARKVSTFVTKKVISVKQKIKGISAKEFLKAHGTVKSELAKAKVHFKIAEKKVLSTVKKNPKKAILFASQIAKAIGQGILAGLREKPVKKRSRVLKPKRKKR